MASLKQRSRYEPQNSLGFLFFFFLTQYLANLHPCTQFKRCKFIISSRYHLKHVLHCNLDLLRRIIDERRELRFCFRWRRRSKKFIIDKTSWSRHCRYF
uniref:Uncharacterized protein n=1 Tax=Rhizophora mucronata TaxID=61149 RepID=A0A2P2JQ61_RHIMU